MKTKQWKGIRGLISLEIVIGVSIVGIILVYTTFSIAQFVNSARDITEKTEALFLAEDGVELIRFLRDEEWTNISSLSVGGTHYLAVTSSSVESTTTPEIIDGFSRSFTIQNVYRNSSTDDIVASTTGGSVADTSSKYVTVTVEWAASTKEVSLTTILADISP